MSAPFQDEAHAALAREGLAAARAVARRAGLPDTDLRVLSARGNLVVHLAPAPVVARVATATAWSRADPAAWLRREVAVAGWVSERGAAVLAPWRDPGPHAGGPGSPVVTLWEHADVLSRRPSPARAGEALAALHAELDAPGAPELPWLTPVHQQVDEALDGIAAAGLLDDAAIELLRRARDRALEGIAAHDGPVGVLHGDAHAGNLVAVGGDGGDGGPRWCWTDLEETCRGPRAWDLAVLAASAGEHGAPRALAAYAAAAGTTVPDAATLAPFAAARRVEAAAWTVAMAAVRPSRYARLVDGALRACA